ncbi:cysteine desulfurase [Patescibacteria group bacterium]|nr:MAG: cysteine desulfurase [Patescibacteria group bacterium]
MLPKPKKNRNVYLDHAATTAMDERVLKAMRPYFLEQFGNPSSLYNLGRTANRALASARATISAALHALPENIIFTSGGTESDNLAIYGIARAHQSRGQHIISTLIEHHAVLGPLADLKKDGWDITYAGVNKEGFVSADEIIKKIRKDTTLVSVMYGNNEVGSIQPIAEIGRAILKYRKENNTAYPYFHTDACQAAGALTLDVEKLHVDLMTINGSKIYGPKGAGILYLRRGVKIKPMILGGGQEKRTRSGTENVPAIIGLAEALKLAQADRIKEGDKQKKLCSMLWNEIQKKIPKVKLNGPEIGDGRLPNNLNVTFMDVEGEALLLYLDEYGVMCSTGSACTSESLEPSHVLMAMGLPYEYAHGSLRFTFGRENSLADVTYLMKYLPAIVEQLRELSPVSIGFKQHAKYKK